MKFSTFLFSDSRDPARDGAVIDETIREAVLADALGVDIVWLAEHHFDGIAVYADPIGLAGVLAASLKHAGIGFAVVQTALHHPIRLAEQIAFLDQVLKGKLIVGLGRGSSFNIYDYQGFGLDHREAQDRLEEAEAIMLKAWTGGEFTHEGRFWQLQVPMLRPAPYTWPHPVIIRGSSTDESLAELAREGKPWMMNVQSLETTRRRVELYRETMLAAGFDEEAVAANLAASWVWRNIFVAATDAEAERIGVPLFDRMTRDRAEMRNRYAAMGQRIVPRDDLPGMRKARGEGLIHGSPARVAEDFAALDRLGVGGVINTFRLGAMPHEVAAASLDLFMREVAPNFRSASAKFGEAAK
ncbi:MAG TPA: LLM class flavin-dependent oxidoreductase [Stellaceae bacterium]|nr:LLM class flavin-dependent oxidoreductase [Stellaceae bacterium]